MSIERLPTYYESNAENGVWVIRIPKPSFPKIDCKMIINAVCLGLLFVLILTCMIIGFILPFIKI